MRKVYENRKSHLPALGQRSHSFLSPNKMQPIKYFAVLPQAPPATVIQELLHKRVHSERFADVSVRFAGTNEGLLGGANFTFVVTSVYNEQVTAYVIREILARFQCTKVNVQKVIGEDRIGGLVQ